MNNSMNRYARGHESRKYKTKERRRRKKTKEKKEWFGPAMLSRCLAAGVFIILLNSPTYLNRNISSSTFMERTEGEGEGIIFINSLWFALLFYPEIQNKRNCPCSRFGQGVKM